MIYNMKAAKIPPNKAREPVAMLAGAAPVAVATPEDSVLEAEAPVLTVALEAEGAVYVPLDAVPLVAGTIVAAGAVAVVTVLK